MFALEFNYVSMCTLLLFSAFIAVTIAEYECPKGWHRFRQKCFHVRNEETTFDKLITICSHLNATPISIHSAEEEELLKRITKHGIYYWLGGVRKEVGKREFDWTDGTKFDYEHWHGPEPDQLGEPDAGCMAVKANFNFEWVDDKCDLKRYQICQKSVSLVDNRLEHLSKNVTKTISDINLTKSLPVVERISRLERRMNEVDEKIDGIHQDIVTIVTHFEEIMRTPVIKTEDSRTFFKDDHSEKPITAFDNIAYQSCRYEMVNEENITKCYYFEKFDVTWNEAKQICESKNAHLVTIHDSNENDYIKSKILYNEDYWTAGIRVIPSTKYFTWESGENFTYANWAALEPRMNLDANCVCLRHGQLFAYNCNKKFSFICKATIASPNYLKSESGTSLINKYASELIALKANIKSMQEELKIYKDRDKRFLKLMNDVADGKIFNLEEDVDPRTG